MAGSDRGGTKTRCAGDGVLALTRRTVGAGVLADARSASLPGVGSVLGPGGSHSCATQEVRKARVRPLLGALLVLAAAARAPGEGLDAASASYGELICRVQRYGTTAAKREAKKAAWDEFFARGPAALGEVMKYIHIDNVAIGVLAQNMVEQMDPEETAPVLAGFLDAPEPRARKMAAYFLGFHETPRYAEQVMALLADDEAAGAALRTLGKWRVGEAFERILSLLVHEKESRRVAAINALRDIGDPRAVPYLVDALNDPHFTVREVAARALVAFPDEAAPALRRALATARDPARRHIIRTLGVLGEESATPLLERLLKDPDPFVRGDVQRALERIGAASP